MTIKKRRLIGEQVHRVLDAIGEIVDIWIDGEVEVPVDPPAPPPEEPEPEPEPPAPSPEEPEPEPEPPAPPPERENGWHVLADLTENLTAAQTYLRRPAVFDLDDFTKQFPDYKVIDLYKYFETASSNRYALTDKESSKKILFRASKPLRVGCKVNLYGWQGEHIVFAGIVVDLPGDDYDDARHAYEIIDMECNAVRNDKGDPFDIPKAFKGIVTYKDCLARGNVIDGLFWGPWHARLEVIDCRFEDVGKYTRSDQNHPDGIQTTGHDGLFILRCTIVNATYVFGFFGCDIEWGTKFNRVGPVYMKDCNFSGRLTNQAGLFFYIHPDNGDMYLEHVDLRIYDDKGNLKPLNRNVIFKQMWSQTRSRNLEMVHKVVDGQNRLYFPEIEWIDVEGYVTVDDVAEDYAPIDRWFR
jgi:hypothetical protein